MIQIRDRLLGPNAPAYVVAEMAWAHDGSLDNGLAIARGAVEAGADALNIHLTSLPDYMVPGYGAGRGVVSAGHDTERVFDYLSRISLAAESWEAVAGLVHDSRLALSCMVNDAASLNLADQLRADVLVVPPACLAEGPYLEALGERRQPIMLGVGGAQVGEIEAALEILSHKGAGPFMLQYGIQSYPTDPRSLNLHYLVTLREIFDLPVLYHDHTEAGTELATQIPLMTLALGVVGIEKHVTHSRAARGEDFESAMEPEEFKTFVSQLRLAESALGQPGIRPLSDSELNYRRVVRKRAVARQPIPAGTRLDYSVVAFKRADAGFYPDEFERCLGRFTRIELNANDAIGAEVID